ncbi:hypothetical protein SAMN03080617_00718 [Algoriphagus alkaliphilus]|uniref:Uncharacterized protein n=1 Tax=Algoriphagus alkaliphilus TaxID=279824 RepID=A0A1G5VVG4_9BACT|nr:hypothetical protein [Algoriphagus alkaliphilus]MBA4301957.1 hypothetical protein [Cyclobacterium sp.]SDA49416.1 hypothetical protein SAMN03080617_00718 [Algoriphagus alkaliphilus]
MPTAFWKTNAKPFFQPLMVRLDSTSLTNHRSPTMAGYIIGHAYGINSENILPYFRKIVATGCSLDLSTGKFFFTVP